MKKLRFSTNILLYFENGTGYAIITMEDVKTNRKSCAIYRTVPFPMILSGR